MPTEMLLLILMKPGFLPKIKTLDMCFHFPDSQNVLQNHILLLFPKISNQIKSACGYKHLIMCRYHNNGSIHSRGPTLHFEQSLKQNSALWDNFYTGNIHLMSWLFVILSKSFKLCRTVYSFYTCHILLQTDWWRQEDSYGLPTPYEPTATRQLFSQPVCHFERNP